MTPNEKIFSREAKKLKEKISFRVYFLEAGASHVLGVERHSVIQSFSHSVIRSVTLIFKDSKVLASMQENIG